MSRKSSMLSAGYAAARPDRIVGNFWIGASSNRDRIRDDLMGLVAHSRKAARDNDHMRAFLNLVERHVIGPTGIALRMQVRDAGGGLDRNTNTAVETEFKRWARRGNCTVCGRHSLASLSRMAVRMSARDGQMFLRLYRGRKAGRWGLRVQALPIDMLDIDKCEEFEGGGYIDGGIECDPLGRPVAYHMFTVHPRSRLARRRERIRVPAAQIIHIGRVSDPEHLLSEPWAHTALRRLSQLSDLDESALAAARYGARKFGFFTRQADAMSPSPVEGDDQDEDTTEIGEWDTLPTGYDVANWDPKYPDQQLGPFAKHMLRAGAAGMGVSYAALTNDLEGANFSSLRAGQGEERDEWRVLQQGFIESALEPLFCAWLEMALLSSAVPGGIAVYDQLDAAAWRPRGWPAVNPKDDAIANSQDLHHRLTSPQRIVEARGHDFGEVLDEIAEAHRMAEERGIPLDVFEPSTSLLYTKPDSGEDKDDDDDKDDA